jgi:hypothetical protein
MPVQHYQPVTERIRLALIRAIGDLSDGINSRFAEKIGVDGSTVGLWINKKRGNIREDAWKKIEPIIRPYLKDCFVGDETEDYSKLNTINSDLPPFVQRQQAANRAAHLKRPLELAIVEKLPILSGDALEKAYDYIRDLIKREAGGTSAPVSPADSGEKADTPRENVG